MINKKLYLTAAILFTVFFAGFSQSTNNTVPVDDHVYEILDWAQAKGLCEYLPGQRPYTKHQIKTYLNQMLDSGVLSEAETQTVEAYLDEMRFENDKNDNLLHFRFSNEANEAAKIPVRFKYDFTLETAVSGGLYSHSAYNMAGFDIVPKWSFAGDISDYFSWGILAFMDVSLMKLHENGSEYLIGFNWYSNPDKTSKNADGHYTDGRYIKSLSNMSYLPYSYNRRWQGQFYYLTNLSADGLEGWPEKPGFGFGIEMEARTSLWDDTIIIGAGRNRRSYAEMDKGSSLVLNSRAMPFFGVDTQFNLLPFLKYSATFGMLEYPNASYRYTSTTLPTSTTEGDDGKFWQNAFAINMLEIDTKYVHWDFGSTVVFPKRFEPAYFFPLINYVEYQNHTGDYDNLALFTDLKLRKADLGSIWVSYYADELYNFTKNPVVNTRFMYAWQAGIQWVVPKLPFATLTFRYSKVEPYCYTHHSINYVPQYAGYVCENYTNNGESLGFYLPPNADEFMLRFDITPTKDWELSAAYQLIRHGADFGSHQVPGSSLYSEMDPHGRSDLRKYFLCDGAYQWLHILSANAAYNFKLGQIKMKAYGTAGILVSYFTDINDSDYDASGKGEKGSGFSNSTHIANTDEYPTTFGAVLSLGLKIWF